MARARGGDNSTTREALFDVAADFFMKRGYHATSVRDIAKALGLTPAAIYNHVDSKQDLLLILIDRASREGYARLMAAVQGIDEPAQRLHAAIKCHVEYVLRKPEPIIVEDQELRALTAENLRRVLDWRDQYSSVFRRIFEEGRDTGVFHVPDVTVATNAVLTMATQVALWYRPSGKMTPSQIGETLADLFIFGVVTRPKTRAHKSSSTK